jgi:simple sugar transport system substrate-binding protein
MSKFLKFSSLLVVLAMLLSACGGAAPDAAPDEEAPDVAPEEKIKACFIYVGPIGDIGWTNAHDVGRLYVDEKYDWLETAYAESVPEADAERFIDRFVVEEECLVVFTTSFGFMDPTLAAAEKYPDNYFFHVSGYKRAPNMGTLMADFYQLYYLNGLMAGAMTESDKVGYVAAHPIPELVRHINAFALGVRETNPEATVEVNWIFEWYDPAKAREAAEALIANGVDVLAFTEDTATVVQVAEEYTEKGETVYSFGHYNPMAQFGPNSMISGQLVNWGILYEDILTKIHLGIYTTENLENVDYWGLLSGGMNLGAPASVELGGEPGVPINPIFVEPLKNVSVTDPLLGEISVHDLVFTRIEQMKDPAVLFDPFTGPINDQDGELRIEPGQRLTVFELTTIDWFVDGVIGKANP